MIISKKETNILHYTFEVLRHSCCGHFVWVPVKNQGQTLKSWTLENCRKHKSCRLSSLAWLIFTWPGRGVMVGGSCKALKSQKDSKTRTTCVAAVGAEEAWRLSRICLEEFLSYLFTFLLILTVASRSFDVLIWNERLKTGATFILDSFFVFFPSKSWLD